MKYNLQISLKKTFYILSIVIYMLAILIISDNNINIIAMGYMGWGLLILGILSWVDIKKELICPYIFFLIMAYMFSFGQSLLIPFNMVQADRNLLNLVSHQSLYYAQVYTLMCLGFFQLGTLITINSNVNKYISKENYSYEKGIKYVGIILLLVSVIPFLIEMYESISIVRTYGYKGLYNVKDTVTGFDSIIKNLASFYIPGIICLLIGCKEETKKRRKILLISLISMGLMLYTGERNNAVIFGMVIILSYHYCIKNITMKNSYKLIIMALVLVGLLNVIADTRKLSDRTFFTYIQYLFEQGINIDSITEIVSELGWSMFPLTAIMDIVPNLEPYREGQTYLYSLLSIIPNLGFWDVHPSASVASLSPWLQQQLNMSYGPGFSLVAESYLNFGWYGSSIFIVLGIFYEKMFSLCNKINAKYYPQLICYVLIFFNAAAFTMRDTFLGNIRAIFYMALPIYILIKFINRSININEKN